MSVVSVLANGNAGSVWRRAMNAGVIVLACALLGLAPAAAETSAGSLGFSNDTMPKAAPGEQMLLESDQLVYDYDNSSVSAVGAVKIYYNGYTLEAKKVTYDQKNKKMVAEGGVRIVDRTGAVVTAESIDITDDFATGFVDSLRLDTPDQTHFAAEKAYRDQGKTTTFYRGVYTACEPCREKPEKAPVWQVKAARIIADHNEHMIYFRSASLEFLGIPVAYFPAFSAPDPTVKRKSGFLIPSAGYTSALGAFAKVPYFWATAPNYDVTFTPTLYSRQGLLIDLEWRQRLDYGQYVIRMAGIDQADPNAFYDANTRNSGVTDLRGGARTIGEYYLSKQWTVGWDATWLSDRTFSRDYSVLNDSTDVAVSNLHITGESATNYFDMRGYYFKVLTNDQGDQYDQARQPVVAPVADQNYIFDTPVLGGQVVMRNNLVSLTRGETDYVDPENLGYYKPGDAVLGLQGNFNRASTNWTWQASQTTDIGMVFKPFAYMQADAFYLDQSLDEPNNQLPGVNTQGSFGRIMPAVGMEWRWPILAAGGASNFIFEPIAQIIARPDEQMAGQLPNEDAQSLVFDDSLLFVWDKFSGYDRVEGGTRANVGFRYVADIGEVATVRGIVGQSYQLAGLNSFGVQDLTQTGAVSGLQNDVSDYVGSATIDGGAGYFLTAGARVDSETFNLNQAQITATGKLGDVTGSATYLFLRQQPAIASGYSGQESDTVSGKASWQFTETWRLFGSLAWDFHEQQMAGNSLGFAYDDECTTFSIAYSQTTQDYTDLQTSKSLMVNLQLRTLGATHFKSDIGGTNY